MWYCWMIDLAKTHRTENSESWDLWVKYTVLMASSEKLFKQWERFISA